MHLLGIGDLEHSCDVLRELFSEYGMAGLSSLADVMAAASRSPSDASLLKSVFDRPKDQRDSSVDSLPPEGRRRLEGDLFPAPNLHLRSHSVALSLTAFLYRTAQHWFVTGAGRPESGSIRTASIVVSWPTGEVAQTTGGHNLDAKVGRFVADDAVQAGQFNIVREGTSRVVHYSPADSAHLPEWLRGAATDPDDATLIRSMKSTLRLPIEVPENRPFPPP